MESKYKIFAFFLIAFTMFPNFQVTPNVSKKERGENYCISATENLTFYQNTQSIKVNGFPICLLDWESPLQDYLSIANA